MNRLYLCSGLIVQWWSVWQCCGDEDCDEGEGEDGIGGTKRAYSRSGQWGCFMLCVFEADVEVEGWAWAAYGSDGGSTLIFWCDNDDLTVRSMCSDCISTEITGRL